MLAESKVAVKSFSPRTGYTEKVEFDGLRLCGSDEAHAVCAIRAVPFNESDTGDCHLCVKTLRVSSVNDYLGGQGNRRHGATRRP